jgi:hypothetical protein
MLTGHRQGQQRNSKVSWTYFAACGVASTVQSQWPWRKSHETRLGVLGISSSLHLFFYSCSRWYQSGETKRPVTNDRPSSGRTSLSLAENSCYVPFCVSRTGLEPVTKGLRGRRQENPLAQRRDCVYSCFLLECSASNLLENLYTTSQHRRRTLYSDLARRQGQRWLGIDDQQAQSSCFEWWYN